ncbi:MAG TPA: alpha/beta fold hydrolase [Chloroflexota bacterium]
MNKLWLLLLLPLALLVLGITMGPEAAEVLVRNTPSMAWATRLLPPAPTIERLVQPTPGDESQTGAVYVPNGRAAPGVLLVNGAEVPGGWRSPDVEAFASSIADLGLTVYVPDLPGFEQGALSTRALEALKQDLSWFSQSTNVSGGRVALVGVCVGGSLALALAEDPRLAASVRSVVTLDPYSRIANAIQAATTGHAPGIDGQRTAFQMEPWVREAMVRSLAGTVADAPSRAAMLVALSASPPDDPLRTFREQMPGDLSAAGAAWWRLLGNTDPASFERLYAALPDEVRGQLDELSPGERIARVSVPVLIAAPYQDFAFPPGEAAALQRGNPRHVRLTRTSALDHVTPTLSPGLLRDYWRLWQFASAGVQALR